MRLGTRWVLVPKTFCIPATLEKPQGHVPPPCRLPVVRKAIREFLESKLRALKQARSEGAIGRDLPGRIIFWPPPKNVVEARLHGILEGLGS
jgi:hypothetical protein